MAPHVPVVAVVAAHPQPMLLVGSRAPHESVRRSARPCCATRRSPSSPGIAGPSQQGLHVLAMQGCHRRPAGRLVQPRHPRSVGRRPQPAAQAREPRFPPRRMDPLRPAMRELINPVWSTGSPTPVGSSSWPSFADRYPIRVVCRLFGLPDSDAEQDVDAIIEHCRARLADFKVPQYVDRFDPAAAPQRRRQAAQGPSATAGEVGPSRCDDAT